MISNIITNNTVYNMISAPYVKFPTPRTSISHRCIDERCLDVNICRCCQPTSSEARTRRLCHTWSHNRWVSTYTIPRCSPCLPTRVSVTSSHSAANCACSPPPTREVTPASASLATGSKAPSVWKVWSVSCTVKSECYKERPNFVVQEIITTFNLVIKAILELLVITF